MPKPLFESIPKKRMPIVFMLDTSEGMGEARMDELNGEMREFIGRMKEKSAESPDYDVMIGVLTFSTDVRWITSGLVSLADFNWDDLTAGGMTSFGAAVREIDRRFTRKDLFAGDAPYVQPFVICFMGGAPADPWEDAVNEARKNLWFANSKKTAVALGDAADTLALRAFCGFENDVHRCKSLVGCAERIIYEDIPEWLYRWDSLLLEFPPENFLL